MAAIRTRECISFLMGLLASGAMAADDFPYEAYVAIDGAEVVSGPGHRYYATTRLARGTRLDVYREEASGWLAIRPPEGSFSWVDAEFIERSAEDDATGHVTEPTPAWIGTAAERVREHRQHVMLKADEVVQILGEKQVGSEESDDETWLKIAPPAGEFRWIHLRDVSRQEPGPLIEDRAAASEQDELATAERESPQEPRRIEVPRSAIALRDLESVNTRPVNPRKADAERTALRDRNVAAAQYRSTSETPGKAISSDGFVPRKRRGSEQLQPVPVPSERLASRQTATFTGPRNDANTVRQPSQANAMRSTISTTASAQTDSTRTDDLAQQVEQLDVELSLMLAENKSTWNLAGLRQRVEDLVQRGTDPVARGQARILLDKIKQFEETFDVEDFGPIATSTTSQSPSAADASGGPSPADPRYDGTGWLKPVVSRRNDKPPAPFALVDTDGKPVCFITPSPGLNLNRYLNKQVGVYGRRGYIELLKTSHVTAERVIDLQRHLR